MSKEYKQKTADEISTDILQASPNELKDATALFNLYLTKKSAIRATKCDEVIDSVLSEIKDRVARQATALDDEVLLKYLKTLADVQEKSILVANGESSIPQIKITQNNVSVQPSELSRESREKVLDFIEHFMKSDSVEVEGDI